MLNRAVRGDVFLGVTRFDELQQRVGISRNILDHRPGRLVGAGVLEKVPYREHPSRRTDRRSRWSTMPAVGWPTTGPGGTG